jgi:hypothetical protein
MTYSKLYSFFSGLSHRHLTTLFLAARLVVLQLCYRVWHSNNSGFRYTSSYPFCHLHESAEAELNLHAGEVQVFIVLLVGVVVAILDLI